MLLFVGQLFILNLSKTLSITKKPGAYVIRMGFLPSP